MASAEESDEQLLDHLVLADDDPAELLAQALVRRLQLVRRRQVVFGEIADGEHGFHFLGDHQFGFFEVAHASLVLQGLGQSITRFGARCNKSTLFVARLESDRSTGGIADTAWRGAGKLCHANRPISFSLPLAASRSLNDGFCDRDHPASAKPQAAVRITA